MSREQGPGLSWEEMSDRQRRLLQNSVCVAESHEERLILDELVDAGLFTRLDEVDPDTDDVERVSFRRTPLGLRIRRTARGSQMAASHQSEHEKHIARTWKDLDAFSKKLIEHDVLFTMPKGTKAKDGKAYLKSAKSHAGPFTGVRAMVALPSYIWPLVDRGLFSNASIVGTHDRTTFGMQVAQYGAQQLPSRTAKPAASKRKRLEAAGWKFGSAQDFLELSDEDMKLVEARRLAAESPKTKPHALVCPPIRMHQRIEISEVIAYKQQLCDLTESWRDGYEIDVHDLLQCIHGLVDNIEDLVRR